MDLQTAEPKTSTSLKRLTVSELTSQIRGVLEPAFIQVWVQGEVSNYRPAASGHAYFSLKDAGASISVATFGWGRRKSGFELKDGLQIACRGKISVYPPRGNYQFVADHLEPLGSGALQAAFEQLKLRLSEEGLFDVARKKPLPRFPSSVAIVTSPSGAAVQDILTILNRRAPHMRVVVIPALMQGDEAPAQIARGLEAANRLHLGELVVLARGGGSIEDLWGFNSEPLARVIAASKLPVVSAVGHEIDFTISDFVSDLRAPTPSAAAEIITGNWVEARACVEEYSSKLKSVMKREILTRRTLVSHLIPRLVSPKDRLRIQAQRTDELVHRMQKSMDAYLSRRKATVEQQMGKLDALSPLRVLERGYTLVRDPGDKSILYKSAEQVQTGTELEVTFYNGSRLVRAL